MLGEPSNERSGKAIQERQRQGENATYHFIDHQAIAIRRIGKIVIEVFAKIYDTKRTIKIMGEDGSDSDIMLDPDAKQAYEKRKAETEEGGRADHHEPHRGALRRDERRWAGLRDAPATGVRRTSLIAETNPTLMNIIGDLVLLAADFPMADEAAERLRRMVPPQALGDSQEIRRSPSSRRRLGRWANCSKR